MQQQRERDVHADVRGSPTGNTNSPEPKTGTKAPAVAEAAAMRLFSGNNKSDTRLLLELASIVDKRPTAVAELDRRASRHKPYPLAARLIEATKHCRGVAGADLKSGKQEPLTVEQLDDFPALTKRIRAVLKKFPHTFTPPSTDNIPVIRRPFEGSPDRLTVGETAVGAGCFLRCAVSAGMHAEWMAESDPDTLAVALRNCPGTATMDSVFERDPAALPWVHVLMGGTCCQPFSRIGKRMGWADDRAYTTLRLLHIATVQKNWFVVIENVAELLVAHEGKVWSLIKYVLQKEGYHVQAVQVNPVHCLEYVLPNTTPSNNCRGE